MCAVHLLQLTILACEHTGRKYFACYKPLLWSLYAVTMTYSGISALRVDNLSVLFHDSYAAHEHVGLSVVVSGYSSA